MLEEMAEESLKWYVAETGPFIRAKKNSSCQTRLARDEEMEEELEEAIAKTRQVRSLFLLLPTRLKYFVKMVEAAIEADKKRKLEEERAEKKRAEEAKAASCDDVIMFCPINSESSLLRKQSRE